MKKNVLLVTLDQWRGDCLSHLGHPGVVTRTLTRLARKGVTFRRHFAQGTPCAPSRMSLYSGRYVFNHRVVTNDTPIDPHVLTLPHYLRAQGYDPLVAGHTSTVWSPEGRAQRDPILTEPALGPGWSPLRSFDGNRRRYLEHLLAQGYPHYDSFAEIFHGVLERTNEAEIPASPIKEQHSETAWLIDSVIDHVRYCTDRPWAIHLSVFKPHPPFFPSERFAAAARDGVLPGPVRDSERLSAELGAHPFLRFGRDLVHADYLFTGMAGRAADLSSDSVDRVRRAYFALCNEVDHQLGRIFDALEETGAAAETLVIVTSDHGELLGDQRLWGKATCFPEAFHVPLIVFDPSPVADATRGLVVADFTENIDLLPTIMAWLGGQAEPGWDGQSLLPYIHDGRHPAPRRSVSWEFDFRNYPVARLGPLAAIERQARCVSGVLSDDALYIHFPALEPLAFDVSSGDTNRVDYEVSRGGRAVEIGSWGRRTLLDLRMTRADNRRTALVRTDEGIVTRLD